VGDFEPRHRESLPPRAGPPSSATAVPGAALACTMSSALLNTSCLVAAPRGAQSARRSAVSCKAPLPAHASGFAGAALPALRRGSLRASSQRGSVRVKALAVPGEILVSALLRHRTARRCSLAARIHSTTRAQRRCRRRNSGAAIRGGAGGV